MNAAESMKAKLAPLGIYRLENSAVADELAAYGSGLDALDAEANVLYREAFLDSAETFGLAVREQIFGRERIGETTEKRRELLFKRLGLNGSDFTVSGIKKALESFNMAFRLDEYPAQQKVNIIVFGDPVNADRTWMQAQTEKIMPAHIDWQLVFNSMSWQQLDSLGLTFAEWDASGNTWELLDDL